MKAICFLAILSIGAPAWACLEKPKDITLSETTFADHLKMSFRTNCRVSVTLADKKYERRISEQDGKICMTILPVVNGRGDYDKKKEYCGGQSSDLDIKNALTIWSGSGTAVGSIEFDGKKLKVLSKGNGAGLEMNYESGNKGALSAMHSGSEIGRYELESKACSRGSAPRTEGTVDLAGKRITTSGAGCSSGMNVEEYSRARRPVFSIDGNPVSRN